MVDVVTNHMGYNGCGDCVDYSRLNPFNRKSYFHDFCEIDYSNENAPSLQVCWEGDNTVSLPDLRTESNAVRAIWKDWITQIISKYKVDGLRIDSAKHIEKDFHRFFEDAAGVYTIGEALSGDPGYVLDYQHYMSGVLNYPAFFWMKSAFVTNRGAGFTDLVNGINSIKASAVNTSYLGSFSENHDQGRWPHITSDKALIKNAITLTMMMDGIPVIYQGQEQYYKGDTLEGRAAIWFSKYNAASELSGWIGKLNAIRSRAISKDQNFISYKAWPIYNSDGTMVLRKGFDANQIISVFSNWGSGVGDYSITLPSRNTGLRGNQQVVDVLSCSTETAGSGGDLSVRIHGGIPRVYAPVSMTEGSGICSM
jgi:alpha-amylase